MVYISNGRVLDSRSSWSISSITDLFWGVVDFVILYLNLMKRTQASPDSYEQKGFPEARKRGSSSTDHIQSIINPHVARRGTVSSSFSGYDDGRGPPGFPRRKMGQIRHFGGGPAPPPMGGGG